MWARRKNHTLQKWFVQWNWAASAPTSSHVWRQTSLLQCSQKWNSRVKKSTTTQKPLQSLCKTLQKFTPWGRSERNSMVSSLPFRKALNHRTKGKFPKTEIFCCTPSKLWPGCLLLPSSCDTAPHGIAMTFLLLPTDSLFQEGPSLQKRPEHRA